MASESGRLSGPRDRELATRRRPQTRKHHGLTCVIVNLSDDAVRAFQIRFHWPKVKCLRLLFFFSPLGDFG